MDQSTGTTNVQTFASHRNMAVVVTYRSRNDSKTATSPKTHHSVDVCSQNVEMGHDLQVDQ